MKYEKKIPYVRQTKYAIGQKVYAVSGINRGLELTVVDYGMPSSIHGEFYWFEETSLGSYHTNLIKTI